MRVFIYIDKSWTNKEGNESVPKHRMICWSKIAIYIYLWLMGLSIGTWINCQNVCAYIILSAFFPYNTLVPHFTEAETGGKICFLLLSSALNMFNIWVLPAFGSFNYCVYWFFVVGVFFFKFVWFRYSCTWFNRSENKQREIKKNLLQQQIQSLL